MGGYEDSDCPVGIKYARCIKVRARVNNAAKEAAYNGEVFGRVRFENGESALYGDFADASDAGKAGDIDEIPAGDTEVNFILKLQNEKKEDKLNFVNMKVRCYP